MIVIASMAILLSLWAAAGEIVCERDHLPKQTGRLLVAVVVVFFGCVAAFGQAVYYNGQATVSSRSTAPGQSAPIYTMPYASITVCSASLALPNTCLGSVAVYSNAAMTTPITQPFTADAQGNYGFYAPQGQYLASLTGAGGASFLQPITITGAGPATVVTANGANGNFAVSNQLTALSTNGNYNEEVFPGATIAARVNAAVAACGSSYLTTCHITIPPTAPQGIGWTTAPSNVIISDYRYNNGQGYLDNALPGMRNGIYITQHLQGNDPLESTCTFCGKNLLALNIVADGGATNNFSNASAQALVAFATRNTGSSRAIWGANIGFYCNNLLATCYGLEIDTANGAGVDDSGLTQNGLRIVNNGWRSGIGIAINGLHGNGADGLPTIRGYYINQDNEDYHLFGTKYHTSETTKAADIYIVPAADDMTPEIRGRNAADSSDSWLIDGMGNAAFNGKTQTGTLAVTSHTNSTAGLQHVRGAVGCTTAATAGASCTSPNLQLKVAEPDLSYTMTCSLDTATGVPSAPVITKGLTTFNITLTAVTAAATTANYNCMVMHD